MAEGAQDPRRSIPGVDTLLDEAGTLVERYGHDETVFALRHALAQGRDEVGAGQWPGNPADPAPYLDVAQALLIERARPSIRRVLNATGVVLHTNLGRARLAVEATEAAVSALSGYSNLEFDLPGGKRGSRYVHARALLQELTGAEDALVVNNCSAALLLALSATARGRSAAISRGELVEIGGGFRIPEVMERANVELHEVGTTNRTRIADYAEAAESIRVAALLKVHRSNFTVQGFTETATTQELAELGRRKNLPLIHDLGSGLLMAAGELDLPAEPTPMESVKAGADVVVFSGDKLLGGPQAGLVVGRQSVVDRMRRDPLCRAFRVDKGTLAALEATLRLYRDPESARARIPTLRALSESAASLRERTEGVLADLAARMGGSAPEFAVAEAKGRVGGGTFPNHEIPSVALRIGAPGGEGAETWAARARQPDGELHPVVGRVEDGAWWLDLRAVEPQECDALVETVAWSLGADAGE